MSLTLHIIKPSVNSMCVRVFTRAAGLEVTEVDAYGQTRSAEFLQKCPAHLTPLLEDDDLQGLALWESGAIMQYLCNKLDLHEFYPSEPARRARIDSALLYVNGSFYPAVARAIYPVLGFPLYPGEVGAADVSTEVRNAARQAAEDSLAEPLDVFHGCFLGGKDFIGGASPSIADFRFASILEFFPAIDYAFQSWARNYVQRMENQLGEAWREPAADVRGYIQYIKSQAA